MELDKPSQAIADECGVQITEAVPNHTNNANTSDSEQRKAEEERREKRKLQKEQYLKELLSLRDEARQFLSMDKTALYEQLSDSVQTGEKLKSTPDYNIIENDLLELTQSLFPNQDVKIYKFGSRISGIGTRKSDLDIFIDIGDISKTYENRPSEVTLQKIYKLRDAFKSCPKSWKDLVVYDTARVPVLRLVHAKSNIECDVNISTSLGHVNTLLIEYIFSLQPISRLLCIYMKDWLILTGFKAAFSTYSMNLMVIFYLQHLNCLPPIQKLFENVELAKALIIGPWLGTYNHLKLTDLDIELTDSSNIMTFVKGFFKFYIAFDYENQVVCPYTGKAVKKEELPTVMPKRYTTFVESNQDFVIELDTPMTIQDPIQLDHNITKIVTELGLLVFKELMEKSWQIITHMKTSFNQRND